MRVSAGAKLSCTNAGEEKLNNADELVKGGDGFWMKADLTPGADIQTVTLTPAMHLNGRALRHLIVKPTDQSGATFDIESVRLVFRKEHLATIASGVAWQGLKEIYRESIAARAPEASDFTVTLPERPWPDVRVRALGE